MDEVPEDTNQGTPLHGDPYAFPCFGNVVPPMMATLNLPRFTVGLPIWFFSTPVVPNSLDTSQEISLCQGNQTNINPSHPFPMKSSSTPSSSSSESTTTSSQEPKKKKRKS